MPYLLTHTSSCAYHSKKWIQRTPPNLATQPQDRDILSPHLLALIVYLDECDLRIWMKFFAQSTCICD
eukprot:SAG31_NODE_1352_length_8668_cov_38.573229_7_plen_68_part_00